MLFLAALIHGILIIGVTFNAVLGDEFAEAISLEVTIVADPDPNAVQPDEAEYLAQSSQQGAGNTQEQSRPSPGCKVRCLSTMPAREDGDSAGRVDCVEESADQVLTSSQPSRTRCS